MISKFHDNLINKVTTLSKSEIECVVSSCNFLKTKSLLEQLNLPYTAYPFIGDFFVTTNITNLKILAEENCVSFLSGTTEVTTQINKVKHTLNLNKFTHGENLGKGITIAFIDTGIYPHVDFLFPKNKLVKFVDLINNRTTPYDDNGHGTFVASICLGSGKRNNNSYCGIAPLADIVMIKALNKKGETNSNKILDAMQYIYDHSEELNIKVVCMSFGADSLGEHDPLQKGANALWEKGIVVVAAAGNSGPDKSSIKSPGTSSKIITVGGLDATNPDKLTVADFSSRGPVKGKFKPDLIAPSVNVTGANITPTTPYIKMSGTSVATPIIAGICAIELEKNPKITPDKLKYFLLNNCSHINYDKNSEGFGYLKFN